MPNQRKRSKVHLGGYYERELKDDLRQMAKSRGITLSELVQELLQDGVAAYKRQPKMSSGSQYPSTEDRITIIEARPAKKGRAA